MDIARMRQRIIFLKPKKVEENAVGEDVMGWYPFSPIKGTEYDKMYVTEDNESIFAEGVLYTFAEMLHDYGIWACVAPMNGREYEEAQKLREETTYNITTRYIENVKADMKIMYGAKVFNIVSILDVGGRKRELKIVASEADMRGKG